MRQQGPEARFDAARQIDALPQHDGSAQNLGIPLAQFGIADQYDREGRRRKVVQMFENLYTVVACQVAAKPDAVDVDQCESVFFAGFVKEYVARVQSRLNTPFSCISTMKAAKSSRILRDSSSPSCRVLSNGWAERDRGGGFESQLL